VTSRHLKLLVLLLPLLIARSLLPIGFMLSFDEGIPRIVFCPGEISVPGTPDSHGQHDSHTAHLTHQGPGHEHHHGANESDANSAEHSHQTCPFAFAGAAPLTFLAAFSPELPAPEAITGPPDPAIFALAPRAHPIRGPPTLS
jgi:hypothetical protein